MSDVFPSIQTQTQVVHLPCLPLDQNLPLEQLLPCSPLPLRLSLMTQAFDHTTISALSRRSVFQIKSFMLAPTVALFIRICHWIERDHNFWFSLSAPFFTQPNVLLFHSAQLFAFSLSSTLCFFTQPTQDFCYINIA